jgi:hypothetical protein
MVAIVGWGVIEVRYLTGHLSDAYTNQYDRTRLVSEANLALIEWNRAVLNHIMTDDQQMMDMYEKTMNDKRVTLLENLQTLSSMQLSARGKALIQAPEHDYMLLEPIWDRVRVSTGSLSIHG